MRQVRIHDTLSGEVRTLDPREPPKVGIYACGPTVYGRIHVGNARPYVVFALLKRFLEHEGYETTFVANVTDVNDKIYDAARDRGVPSEELAEEMTVAYFEDTAGLGLGRPDAEPKASETIEAIVALIEDLIEGGHAYEARGDVYFRVASYDGYGKLSNRPLEEMQQGEGDDAAELKESPQDFALWKARKEGEDTFWESPWGDGRPGWHIECSAMAEEILGVDFEIHGGGSDLVFPHHENEIAQTEAARGKPLARLWMHNGMVEMGQEKMAKSVGNIRLLHGALEQFGREAFLMWLVGAHYRKPVAYTEETLEDASAGGGASARRGAPARPRRRAGRRPRRPRRALLRRAGRRLQHRRRPRRALRVGRRGQPAHGRGRAPRPGPAGGDAARVRAGEPARGRRRGGARGDPAPGGRARGGARRTRLRAGRSPPRRARGGGLGSARHAGGRSAGAERLMTVRGRISTRNGAPRSGCGA